MKVRRLDADDAVLMDLESNAWDQAEAADVKLEATPISAQPSGYVQAKWKNAAYGETRSIEVRAVHNEDRIYFRLEWSDPDADDDIRDTNQFADAAAVLFPVGDDAPLQSMGSPQQPVNAWYWRPDLESPFNISAQGTGTTRRSVDPELDSRGRYSSGRWSVVVRRAMTGGSADDVSLSPGENRKVAFAVWQGSNQERGGLKSATLEWEPLEIEA